jgi:hypothetical protein
MRTLGILTCILLLLLPHLLRAEEKWAAALEGIPLQLLNSQLHRTNCVEVILKSFRSNPVLKGIVFLPGATDELYLNRRVEPRLTSPAPSLFDGIDAITNGGFIRATFRPPLLLLHTDSDPLEPIIVEEPDATASSFNQKATPSELLYLDGNWEKIQPDLRRWLGTSVVPAGSSRASWHFYRHNLCGFHLSGKEVLQAVCLSGKTRATINRHGGLLRNRIQVVFYPDTRILSQDK